MVEELSSADTCCQGVQNRTASRISPELDVISSCHWHNVGDDSTLISVGLGRRTEPNVRGIRSGLMIAVHMGVGHHSKKLEPKYKEGGRPSWHPHSAFGHSIARCSHLMPCWTVPAVMAAAIRRAEEAMHAQGDAIAAVQAAIAAMEVMFG